MTADNEQLVTRLCKGLQGPIDEWVALLADDLEYVNVPLGPALKGPAECRKFLEPFVGDDDNLLESQEILHTVSAGNVVMNERVEVWVKGDVRTVLPVAGVFEVENGKVAGWRDYWDLPTLQPFLDAVLGPQG
jgi:limonene-1,2-epoxide hydrolase